MAKIIKKSSHLQREYQRKQHHALRWFLLSLLGIILFVAGIAPLQPALIVIGLAWFFVCVLVALVPVRGLNGLKAGIQGELDGAALLQDLPDTYLCLQNATVSYRGKESELDLVVAGPTGLVIVEVKNRNGHITGNFESKDWVQHKIGRRGGEYDGIPRTDSLPLLIVQPQFHGFAPLRDGTEQPFLQIHGVGDGCSHLLTHHS